MTAFKNVSFDDRDTDHLRYNAAWFLEGSWNASSVGETGTLASANDLTANVTFTFPMPANAFYYYGIPRCCGGFYAICVDCSPDAPNFIPIDAVDRSDDGKNPPVVLYSITFNQPGVHEIILINQNDTRFGHSQITIDRFDLQVVDDSAAPSTSAVQTLSSFATNPNPQATGGSSVASTANATATSTPLAAIIGGAFGGCVLIAVLVLLFILLYRRKQRKSPYPTDPVLHQQYAPRVGTPMSNYYMSSPGMRQSMITINTTATGSLAPLRNNSHWASPSISATSVSGASSYPVRETDAGRIADGNPTLPPEYEQVFSRGPSVMARGVSDVSSHSGTSASQPPAGPSTLHWTPPEGNRSYPKEKY